MSLFDYSRIVPWAEPGEIIPLKCARCGANFLTRNLYYIGYYEIYFDDPPERARNCKHSLKALKPDPDRYEPDRWMP